MCDYSLEGYRSREAKVGDQLVSGQFTGSGMGMMDANDRSITAGFVCLKPGTEVQFTSPPQDNHGSAVGGDELVARFNQIDKENRSSYHDCFEFPNGHRLMVSFMAGGIHVNVLQLPAEPLNVEQQMEQHGVTVVEPVRELHVPTAEEFAKVD
jgi:hypothetical protein